MRRGYTPKDLVERFEPGVHAFSQLVLQRSSGEIFSQDYYLFSAQQDIDCLVTHNKDDAFRHYWTSETGVKQIVCLVCDPGVRTLLSEQATAGLHLWTAGLLGQWNLFISDEFAAALQPLLRPELLSLDYCEDIQCDWVAEDHMGPLLARHRAFVKSGRSQVDYTIGDEGS